MRSVSESKHPNLCGANESCRSLKTYDRPDPRCASSIFHLVQRRPPHRRGASQLPLDQDDALPDPTHLQRPHRSILVPAPPLHSLSRARLRAAWAICASPPPHVMPSPRHLGTPRLRRSALSRRTWRSTALLRRQPRRFPTLCLLSAWEGAALGYARWHRQGGVAWTVWARVRLMPCAPKRPYTCAIHSHVGIGNAPSEGSAAPTQSLNCPPSVVPHPDQSSISSSASSKKFSKTAAGSAAPPGAVPPPPAAP